MYILYIPIICIYDNVCDVLIIHSQQGFASFYALSLFSGEANGNNTCREIVSETSMISSLLHTSWHCERIGITVMGNKVSQTAHRPRPVSSIAKR